MGCSHVQKVPFSFTHFFSSISVSFLLGNWLPLGLFLCSPSIETNPRTLYQLNQLHSRIDELTAAGLTVGFQISGTQSGIGPAWIMCPALV